MATNPNDFNFGTPAPAATPAATPAPSGADQFEFGSTPAPKPTAQPQPGIAGFAKQALSAGKTGMEAIQRSSGAQAFDTWVAQHAGSFTGATFNAIDYIGGMPQRFVAGTMYGDPNKQNESYWHRVKSGFFAGVHAAAQHDPQYDQKIEDSLTEKMFFTGFKPLGYTGNLTPQDQAALDAFRHPKTERDKIRHAVMNVVAMTLTDPLTIAGPVGMFSKLHAMGRLTSLIEGAKSMQGLKWLTPEMKYGLQRFIEAGEGFTKPAHMATDAAGHQVVVRHPIHGFFHPYAREDFIFRQDTGAYHTAVRARAAGNGLAARVGAQLEGVLRRARPVLRSLQKDMDAGRKLTHADLPRELHVALMSEAIHFGTAAAKKAALAEAKSMGIDLSKWDIFNELGKISKSYGEDQLLRYTYRRNYVPNLADLKQMFTPEYAGEDAVRMFHTMTGIKQEAEDIGAETSALRGRARFERGKKIGDTGEVDFPKNLEKAFETRFRIGARTLGTRFTRRRLATQLGIGDHENEWDNEKLAKHINPWIKGGPAGQVAQYMQSPSEHLMPWVNKSTEWMQSVPAFRMLSEAMTRGITSNGIPHVMNVERLAWLLGGPKALAESLGTAVRMAATDFLKNEAKGLATSPLTKQMSDIVHTLSDKMSIDPNIFGEMEREGVTTHTFEHLPDAPQHWADLAGYMAHWPVFKQWNEANHGMLKYIDDAVRYQAWKTMRAKYPNKSKAELAHVIDEGLGGYMASPAYAKLLSRLGGMFPLWHLRTVLATSIKAMLNRPDLVMGLLRGDKAANQADAYGLQEYGAEAHPIAGSVYEASEEMDAPGQFAVGQTPNYLASRSAVGPLVSTGAKRFYGQGKGGMAAALEQFGVATAATAAGPLGQLGLEGLNAYGSKLPAQTRLKLALFGIYPEYQHLLQDQEAVYRAQNLSPYEAEKNAIRDIYSVRRASGGLGIKGMRIKP